MEQPTPDAQRVPPDQLHAFVHDAARKAGMPEDHAALLARLLIENDLRGVLSHGSHQIVRYVREIRSGGINPRPRVQPANETPTSLIMDGDGGLGYFPAHDGTLRIIEKARQHGMAAMVTRNHGHIGAAGIYARMTLEHDLLTFITSGVQLRLNPGDSVINAAGASPMCFSAPALHEPPLVLDCGVTHGIQGRPPRRGELIHLAPGVVLRALGFGTICQAWGGLLAGIPIDPARAQRQYHNANQGAMIFTFQIALFADPESFKQEMDEYAKQTRQLTPLEGTSGAYLPGGIEADHEQQYRNEGIPLSDRHQQDLQSLAEELGLTPPWR
jgi:L-2-hydroxycarboxylate dehydrogenase (NAD+)